MRHSPSLSNNYSRTPEKIVTIFFLIVFIFNAISAHLQSIGLIVTVYLHNNIFSPLTCYCLLDADAENTFHRRVATSSYNFYSLTTRITLSILYLYCTFYINHSKVSLYKTSFHYSVCNGKINLQTQIFLAYIWYLPAFIGKHILLYHPHIVALLRQLYICLLNICCTNIGCGGGSFLCFVEVDRYLSSVKMSILYMKVMRVIEMSYEILTKIDSYDLIIRNSRYTMLTYTYHSLYTHFYLHLNNKLREFQTLFVDFASKNDL